jgi:hypothetical protein
MNADPGPDGKALTGGGLHVAAPQVTFGCGSRERDRASRHRAAIEVQNFDFEPALAERLAPRTVDGPLLAMLRSATTARARAVSDALSPTAPIIDSRFSLRDRLIWASGARATMGRLWRMVAPLEGATTRDRLRTYRHRATRLLTLVRSPRSRSDDDAADDG